MQSNWNQTPSAVVMDLIAGKNTKFTSAVRAFYGLKSIATNTQSNSASKNTQITVYPTDTTRYKGEMVATYNRINFSTFLTNKLGAASPTVAWGQQSGQTVIDATATPATLATIINTICGIQLAATDYSTLTATMNGMIATLNITFAAGNYLFNPASSASIILDQTTQTSTIITVADLDGLDAPTAS